MNAIRRSICLGFAAAVTLALTGCGGGGNEVMVKGRVTENGAPVKLLSEGLPPGVKGITVAFVAQTQDAQPGGAREGVYSAEVTDDGAFTVVGPYGKGLPKGRYRVSVVVAAGGRPKNNGTTPGRVVLGSPPPVAGSSSGPPAGPLAGMPDRYKGVFGPNNSPLVVEITDDREVVVDLATKQVSLK